MDSFDAYDPQLLATAAHEAGHAHAFHHAGIPIGEIRVWWQGDSTAGHVTLADDYIDEDQLDGNLIALVAGHEAEARWLTEHGGFQLLGFRNQSGALSASRGRCCSDMTNFRRLRRRHKSELTEPAARVQARALLVRRWPHLERLALRLARHRRLTSV